MWAGHSISFFNFSHISHFSYFENFTQKNFRNRVSIGYADSREVGRCALAVDPLFSSRARNLVHRFVTLAICLGVSAACADAQVVLQQPVVGVTGVQTVVSVPDGGSAYLGGVSRARDSRAAYGLAPFGSSRGRDLSRSAMDVRVTIHDFEAMDRRLLAQPRTGEDRFRQTSTERAWQQLSGASSRVAASVPAGRHPNVAAVPAEPRVAAGRESLAGKSPADRLLALGDAALARSDRIGALRYYQSARTLGSTPAARRIEAMSAD